MKEPTKLNGNAKSKILRFQANRPVQGEYYYSDLDAAIVLAAVDAVTRAGGAIMFGRTQDGGAFSMVVLMDTQKAKEYPHGVDEAHDTLKVMAATFIDD